MSGPGAPSAARRSPLALLCAAAFLADLALYLTMTGAPYKALALGAGPLVLGLIPVARALPYSLSTVGAGAFTERGERLRAARVSLVAAAAAVAALIVVPGLAGIFTVLAILGVAFAFFWPAVQARLADLARHGEVTANLGWFNVAWSSGKATGFLLGGLLLAGLGFGAVFAASALAVAAVAVLVWLLRAPSEASDRGGGVAETAAAARIPRPAGVVRRYRLAGWTANAVSFGVVAVLNTHYPNWLEVIGRGETVFGAYLGLIFFSQTAAFGFLTRFRGWRYRPWPLLGAQVPVVALVALLPALRSPWAILATAPPVGLGLGMTYFASLFYSVDDPAARGRNAGVHEALLGIGSLTLPVLGGWAAGASGRLEAPYLFAAAAGMVSLGAQAALVLPRRAAGAGAAGGAGVSDPSR